MSNQKLTDLTELTTVADDDLVYVVDVSDTTDSATGSSRKVQAKNVRGFSVVSGVIRNSGAGWAIIDDASHTPINVDSVSVVGDEILIDYTNLGATEIVSFIVAPDERLARDGIIAGASIGLTRADIRIGAPLNFWVNVDTSSVTTSDWWAGDISVAFADDYMEITHPSVDTEIFFNVDRIGSTTSKSIEQGQTRESTTKTRIYYRTDIYGYLYYDGAAWNETFVNTDFQTPITTNFTGGKLVVFHPTNAAEYDLQVTGRHPYHALHGSFGSTSFDVHFVNASTGADVTTEDTSMRFSFSRKKVKNINSGSIDIPVGSWSFKAPMAWLTDPDLLSDSLKNFWFYGVFKN